ncbi:MAG: GTP-binding protein [Clostridia bacterium]|nr:GTP-binding protein [Clostridia bacterium]
MIKIDLITGFLGSGKTTFIKKYAKYFMDKGSRIGILENDFGAVNVDRMLLQELQGDKCDIETVSGACDRNCHKRRFKTKLISMGMLGYDRVVIEPSGIFDVDEFFDSLHEAPLDRWYEIGNVIAVADAQLPDDLSEQSEYLLASQTANAGLVILSRTQFASSQDIIKTIGHINQALKNAGCTRTFSADIMTKDWCQLTGEDFYIIQASGYHKESYIKRYTADSVYRSLYFMNLSLTPKALYQKIEVLFANHHYGKIYRVKGFIKDNKQWLELNAVNGSICFTPIQNGQEVFIVIGENLNKESINELLAKQSLPSDESCAEKSMR